MSEGSRGLGASAEQTKLGPDYFGFYACEVADLLSHDDDFLPFSSQTSLAGRTSGNITDKDTTKHTYNGKKSYSITGSGVESRSLFSDGIGADCSDFKKERLRSLLQQSVVDLSEGVDEMLDPVFSMCRIQSFLKYKKSLSSCSAAACDEERPPKKLKRSSSSSSISIAPHASPVSCRDSGEVDEDLQFLLENDCLKVEEAMKKYSNELSATLGHMEQKLEELLDTVLSNCRSMTFAEKRQLLKLIQKLPPRNLDRVVEIIRRRRPSENCSADEIHVDLEEEDNATLWRLYYYVEAVENARKLPVLEP